MDVDGVISLFGFPSSRRPAGRWTLVDGIPHLISAEASGHLLALAGDYELAWCTGWEEKANEYLVRELGLPGALPTLHHDAASGPGASIAGHWKLAAIRAFTGDEHPVAWIDDAHDPSCEAWAAERPGPTLLVPTDPAVGITPEHVTQLRAWAQAL